MGATYRDHNQGIFHFLQPCGPDAARSTNALLLKPTVGPEMKTFATDGWEVIGQFMINPSGAEVGPFVVLRVAPDYLMNSTLVSSRVPPRYHPPEATG
jgi:hypothetical protein